jgi:hypothetical protein
MNIDAKHADVTVQLTGRDGNAFAIIGAVRRALMQGGVARYECDQFVAEAMSGDYDNVLQTAMRWVDVT